MTKPLLRWTVGGVSDIGRDILCRSVLSAKIIYQEEVDYLVCYNNQPSTKWLEKLDIPLISQSWGDCPIPDVEQTPVKKDGTFQFDNRICGGSLWKVCPPRLRPKSHEVIIDNDVVLDKRLPQIDLFLSQRSKNMCLEEPIRFLGRYDHLFAAGEAFNSGIMGLAPNFDFGSRIFDVWSKEGCLLNLTYADEQGLLMSAINATSSILIGMNDVVEMHRSNFCESSLLGEKGKKGLSCTWKDYVDTDLQNKIGYHFVQSNRCSDHMGWNNYKSFNLKVL